MNKIFFFGSLVLWVILASCKKDDPGRVQGGLEPDGYVLLDDKYYGYKDYGGYTWLTENMVYLPYVVPSSTKSDTIPYYYVYGYEGTSPIAAKATENFKKYGVLYNWAAAKKACPPGWHLPTDMEWKLLEAFLGMSWTEAQDTDYRWSGGVGYILKSTTDWANYGNGDNSSGFNAFPGGCFNGSGFVNLTQYALFWTASDASSETRLPYTWSRSVGDGVWVNRDYAPHSYGLSVRCVKDQ